MAFFGPWIFLFSDLYLKPSFITKNGKWLAITLSSLIYATNHHNGNFYKLYRITRAYSIPEIVHGMLKGGRLAQAELGQPTSLPPPPFVNNPLALCVQYNHVFVRRLNKEWVLKQS